MTADRVGRGPGHFEMVMGPDGIDTEESGGLQGGLLQDRTWASSPVQPTVPSPSTRPWLAGFVTQFSSR